VFWIRGFQQGPQLPARPSCLTGRTVTALFDQFIAVREFLDGDVAVSGVDASMPSLSGRCDTVEGIGTHLRTDQDIIGMRQSEQVTRLVFRKFFTAPAK